MNQADSIWNQSKSLETLRPPVRQSGSTFDQIKTTVADKLHAAADALHEKSDRLIDRNAERSGDFSGYGHQAAKWLDRSADYIAEADAQRIKADVETQVRRHPGRSLLIAGAAGLVLGALIRRR